MGLSFTSKAWENSKVLLSLERKKPSNFSYPPWKSSGEVPPKPCSHSRTSRRSSICSPKGLQQLVPPL